MDKRYWPFDTKDKAIKRYEQILEQKTNPSRKSKRIYEIINDIDQKRHNRKNKIKYHTYDPNRKYGFTKLECIQCVEGILEIIKQSLEKGDDIIISGFGKFCVNKKKERKGRNPKTGSSMILDVRRVASFKCSKKLRKKINNESG